MDDAQGQIDRLMAAAAEQYRETWRLFNESVNEKLFGALADLGRPDDWAGLVSRRRLYSVAGERGFRLYMFDDAEGRSWIVLATVEPRLEGHDLVARVSDPWPHGRPPLHDA